MKRIFTLNDTKARLRGKLISERTYRKKYAITKEKLELSDAKNQSLLKQALQRDVFKQMFPN